MTESTRVPGRFIVMAMACLLVVALSGAYIVHLANRSRLALPVIGQAPPFSFTERSGTSFGSEQFKGKISVVDFIFTRCTGVCPIMADRMGKLYKAFADYPNVQFVSITVDPTYDTPAILQEYATAHGVTDNRWLFLCGPIDSVALVSEKGLLLPTDSLPQGHSNRFVLVDSKLQIRGYYSSDDEQSQLLLEHHIRALSTAMKQFPGAIE
jgi:protein SCO1/2